MFSAKAALGLVVLLLCGNSVSQETNVEYEDEGWPRVYEKDGDELVLYQPQIDSWEDFSELQARAAVALTLAGSSEPVYGALYMRAKSHVDFETMTVLISERNLSVGRFPHALPEKEEEYGRIVEALLPSQEPIVISVDRVLAYMDASEEETQGVSVNFEPPTIFTSTESAILVMFLGPPKFEPIPGTTLSFATNTNWDVITNERRSAYYLLDEELWLVTPDVLKGPWRVADTLPDDFLKLPEDDNWKEVSAHIPPRESRELPRVFVSTEPAELIAIQGPPYMAPIPDTALRYIANTSSDVFYHSDQAKYYFLTSGRWFRADELEGTWHAVRDDLPEDFANISSSHKKGHVLASVPGTPEALDAVLLASIPTKAMIDREGTVLNVVYNGTPQYKPIEGTVMEHVVNTAFNVIRLNNKHYCCHEGIWFESTGAKGPWELCTEVPEEIYKIPATSPIHNLTYVRVYDSTPDSVEYGYTSGYTGQYIDNGLLYYGSGYPPDDEYYDDSYYGYYDPYYAYGTGVWYNPYRGRYIRRARNYGPYGGVGRAAVYNPATGTYARAATAYGPRGSAYAATTYNPSTGINRARTGDSNIYRSRGRAGVSGDGGQARAQGRSNYRGTVAHIETSAGGQAAVRRGPGGTRTAAVSPSGDVYVGGDGNVYRPAANGNWSRYDGKVWTNTDMQARTGRSASYYQERAQSRPRRTQDTSVQNFDPRVTSRRSNAGLQTNRTRQQAGAQRPVQRSQATTSRGNVGNQLNRQAQARNHGNNRAKQARANKYMGRSRSSGATRGGRRSGGGRRR